MGKRLAKHKRGTQYSLHSSCGCLNFTLWKDGASCLFANNDFDSSKTEFVTSKINDRRKKEYHGIRSYKANEAVRATEMYIIMSIFTTSVYPMGIGITAHVENKCGYLSLLFD